MAAGQGPCRAAPAQSRGPGSAAPRLPPWPRQQGPCPAAPPPAQPSALQPLQRWSPAFSCARRSHQHSHTRDKRLEKDTNTFLISHFPPLFTMSDSTRTLSDLFLPTDPSSVPQGLRAAVGVPPPEHPISMEAWALPKPTASRVLKAQPERGGGLGGRGPSVEEPLGTAAPGGDEATKGQARAPVPACRGERGRPGGWRGSPSTPGRSGLVRAPLSLLQTGWLPALPHLLAWIPDRKTPMRSGLVLLPPGRSRGGAAERAHRSFEQP